MINGASIDLIHAPFVRLASFLQNASNGRTSRHTIAGSLIMQRSADAEQFNHDDEPLTQEQREKQDRIDRIPGQPDPSISENATKTPREILQDAAHTSSDDQTR